MKNKPSILELVIHAPHRVVTPDGCPKPSARGAIAIFCDGIDSSTNSVAMADIRNASLPYEKMWVEYESKEEGMINGENFRYAVLIEELSRTDDTIEIQGEVYTQNAKVTIGPLSAFFVRTDINGTPKYFNDGVHMVAVATVPVLEDSPVKTATGRVAIDVMYAISLMNCKNVEIVDGGSTTDGMSHKQIRGGGRFSVKYKVLKVTVGKNRQYVLGKVNSGEHLDLPLHLVRGHFAEYTPERPLFGRNGQHGRFWIPAHARGAIENGEVVKDYEIKGNANE